MGGDVAAINQEPVGHPDPRRLEVWLPPFLLLVSAIAGALLTEGFVDRTALAWSSLPSAAILVGRVLLELNHHRTAPRWARTTWFVADSALTLALVLLNPLGCIYAFSGYLDAPRLLDRGHRPFAVTATAALCALGQSGGWPNLVARPAFFGVLFAVNVALSSGMARLASQREAAVEARERAAAALEDALRRNTDLQAELVERAREAGVAAERARLSREIHDTVAQGLVGVITQLAAIGPLPDGARTRVERAEESARDCLAEARRAVRALASPRLDHTRLPAALTDLVTDWSAEHAATVTTDIRDVAALGDDVEAALLRVAQEGLANVARHSRAEGVRVTLDDAVSDKPPAVRLHIIDDGCGFDASVATGGFGLTGMGERLRHVGGALRVDSTPGQGCRLVASVPR